MSAIGASAASAFQIANGAGNFLLVDGTITLSDNAVLNLTNLSSSTWFVNTVGDGASGTDVYVSDTACYCRGTRILTARREVAVEELAIGDRW